MYLRATEFQGTTIVRKRSSSVLGQSGTWEQISVVAPILNNGDSLQMRISRNSP